MIKRNPSQQRAIAHLSGPMMVLAGPGSGKTSVIVERTAYMINEGGISPSNILVVTFSRAAAKEMKERFLSFTGQQYTPVTFGTFHGVFYGILKQAYGFTAANILSDEEKFGILRELTLNYGGDLAEEGDFPEEIAREISVVKGNKIALEHYYSSCCPDEVFRQIYQGYREACQSRRKLDFDDMILYCYELFVQRKDILEAWQKKFQYILVDEFQDINQLQYDIVRMLAKPQNNLFIVGDDDQSIYGFRGAKPEIMLKFAEHYPNAVSLHLSTNYRSDRKIIECASNLIHHNKERFDKEFLASHEEEGIVHHQTYNDIDAEQRGLVKMILEKKMSMEEYRNTSILYRTNKEAVQVSDLLITEKIPFWCTEPIQDKYDHWIYRDILSYHKLGIGIGNKMDLNRILNHPQRFLFDPRFFKTDGSLKQLMHVAATLPDGKWKRSKAMDSVEDMFYLFKKLEDKNPVDTLQILESFGRYKIFLHDYAEYRNMSPGELYFYWNSYKADAEKHNDWKEWDAYVRKHKIILQEQLRKHDGIALSTLHRSKGLEWDRVYILNCVKNTIPFAKQGTVEDLEEERRLFYVGCTRAKKELQLLSYQGNSGEISPFIKELKSSESDTSDKVDLDVHLKY